MCFKAVSDLKSELKDGTFAKNLFHYLESIIKQGYLGDTGSVQDVNVSEIFSQRPIDQSAERFEER